MLTDIKNVNILAQQKPDETILDAILTSRGIADKEEYFNPAEKELTSPFAFAQMAKAVDIIKNAIKNNDKILIWGDFDADGVTSTSIVYKTLKKLGANCEFFLPDRLNMGHGLNLNELLKQKAKKHLKVLITVDCGISNIKEIAILKSHGVKTIVTDHHEPLEILPDADCILNPLASDSLSRDVPIKTVKNLSYMSGAGVALKLAFALLDEDDPIKNELIAISSVGIIADVVPLLGESRIIAAKGINEINNGILSGVNKLFKSASKSGTINSGDIAFILAPRINAAGRLDSPFESIKLLVEDNPDIQDITIEKLNMLNKVRQNLCESVTNEAAGMIKTAGDVIVLYNENWHIGIIGIVASKLVEKFHVPAFLITKDETGFYRCSVRSPESYDVAALLTSMKDCFTGFGGHAQAGGFSANSSDIDITNLKKRIELAVLEQKDETKLIQGYTADIELSGEDLNFDLINDLDKMEPYGAENRKPVFLFKAAKVVFQRQIGKDLNHLAFFVEKDGIRFECICWNRPVLGINNGEDIDFIFCPEVNTYGDKPKLQLMVQHIIGDKLTDVHSRALKFFDHRQKTDILDKVDSYVAQKNGEVKIFANSIKSKKLIAKYNALKANLLSDALNKEKTVMLFDYPASADEFKEFLYVTHPENIHIMRNDFSKNPDDYLSMICGMLKFATNNKNGEIDIKTIADSVELDEPCVQTALELLEKIESVEITDDGKIYFKAPPKQNTLHTDSMFEIFKDEFERVINFKTFFQTADIKEIEELATY